MRDEDYYEKFDSENLNDANKLASKVGGAHVDD